MFEKSTHPIWVVKSLSLVMVHRAACKNKICSKIRPQIYFHHKYQSIPVSDCDIGVDWIEHLRGIRIPLSEQSPGVLAVAVSGDFVARHNLAC